MEGKYWDRAWSLVDGCTPCSPGCEHCWAAAMAHRFVRRVGPIKAERMRGEPIITDAGGRFNGRIITHPERLSIPLKRRKPTVYAVWNDLFHEAVPDEFIKRVVLKMTVAVNHTFLVLTKRPERMLTFYTHSQPWPTAILDNVWHGLTVCNQEEANEKIPVFLQVPGKKFLSIEPMLGPVNLSWLGPGGEWYSHSIEKSASKGIDEYEGLRELSAVILGGETGPGARPMHPNWVRSIRDQCAAAGVPFFFKGWGKQKCRCYIAMKNAFNLSKGKSNKNYECPIHDWGQETGRVLDGRTHDDLPWREKGDDEGHARDEI